MPGAIGASLPTKDSGRKENERAERARRSAVKRIEIRRERERERETCVSVNAIATEHEYYAYVYVHSREHISPRVAEIVREWRIYESTSRVNVSQRSDSGVYNLRTSRERERIVSPPSSLSVSLFLLMYTHTHTHTTRLAFRSAGFF